MSKLYKLEDNFILECSECNNTHKISDVIELPSMNSPTGVFYKTTCSKCGNIDKFTEYDSFGNILDGYGIDRDLEPFKYDGFYIDMNDVFIDKFYKDKYGIDIDLGFPLLGYYDKNGKQIFSKHIINNTYNGDELISFMLNDDGSVNIGLSNYHCSHCPMIDGITNYTIVGIDYGDLELSYKEQ